MGLTCVMPHLIDFECCLKTAKEIIFEAGRSLFMPNYIKTIQEKNVEIKDGNTGNLVTQTDKNIQNVIHQRLHKAFPTFKFMGEEDEDEENVKEEELGNEPTWILDPIDGTTNFVHQFEFTVISLALCIDREPVIGIIYCPTREEMFEAVIGSGAFLNGNALKIDFTGLDLVQSLVLTEFGATGTGSESAVHGKMDQINKLARHGVHGIRMLGSAAYNLTRISTNSAQIYFEQGIHAWDVAAGALIVREAGGIISELPQSKENSNDFRVNARSIVAASSKSILDSFFNVINQ